jgi:hypothetical protein
VKDFRDLQEMVVSWTRMHGLLEAEQALGLLVAELADLRAELAAGKELQGKEPAFDPELIRQAREAYDGGDFQEVGEVIRDLQGPSPRAH